MASSGKNGSRFSWISRNSALSVKDGTGIVNRGERDVIGSVTVTAEKNERTVSKTFVTAVLGMGKGLAPKGIDIVTENTKKHITAYAYADDCQQTVRLIVCGTDGSGRITEISSSDSRELVGSFARYSFTEECGDKTKVFLIDLNTMKPILADCEN